MDAAEWYKELPVITRGYVSLCVATTAACALEVILACLHSPLCRAASGQGWALPPEAAPSTPSLPSTGHHPLQHILQHTAHIPES